MNIFFRVDSSVQIGAGHLMRCLTLASELRDKGIRRGKAVHIGFIIRELPGHLCDYVEAKGYDVFRLSADDSDEGMMTAKDVEGEIVSNARGSAIPRLEGSTAHDSDVTNAGDAEETLNCLLQASISVDWLIIDHYGIDYHWEIKLRRYVNQIMVIDDLANRKHDCDIVLDQNYYSNMEKRYDDLVSTHCVKLLGPQHALLRTEFKEGRALLRERDGTVKRILVFYGGSDPTNETAKALLALQKIGQEVRQTHLLHGIQVDVIVGSANPHKEQIEQLCSILNDALTCQINYYCQVENMAYFMSKADLCLGAGGASTWERLFLGLPAITTVIADNQAEVTDAVAEIGTIWNLGWHAGVTVEDVCGAVEQAFDSPDQLRQMGEQGLRSMGNRQPEEESLLVRILMEGEANARR